LLKPNKRINQTLIIKEWPNIQRILVSLGLKTTTQSVIIGKLSSYARKNRTKKAMWEFDSIFRSIYLLNYIDDLLLRQTVQKALNRGEAYHQLHRAIFHEYGGKFRVDSEEQQELWSECSRLLANAIIFYNSYLLSKLLVQLEEKKNFDLLEQLKKVSPIAWRHINLSGRFEFTTQRSALNVDAMLAKVRNFLTLSNS
ncbi:MAG: Tn3 family transposase, partial [Acidobacteriota bacterium]